MRGYTLTEYVACLAARYLNANLYSVNDCSQRILLALWTHKSGSFQEYLKWNVVPKGKKLDLLKGIAYNQRLKFLRDEHKASSYENRKKQFTLSIHAAHFKPGGFP